jgi:hypothetical protein
MKRPKSLLMFAIAGLAAMALSSSASAATLTSPSGTPYPTGNLHAESEGHFVIHTAFVDIACNWTLETEVASHGAGNATAYLVEMTITSCTNGWSPEIWHRGELEIAPIGGGPDGTVLWSEATFEFSHPIMGTCRYVTAGTDGRLTGSGTTGGTATIDFSGPLKFHSGGFSCSKVTEWTGSFTVTSPNSINVD